MAKSPARTVDEEPVFLESEAGSEAGMELIPILPIFSPLFFSLTALAMFAADSLQRAVNTLTLRASIERALVRRWDAENLGSL